jgi:hypothetical protein
MQYGDLAISQPSYHHSNLWLLSITFNYEWERRECLIPSGLSLLEPPLCAQDVRLRFNGIDRDNGYMNWSKTL